MSEIKKQIRNTMNKTLATHAAVPAMTPKPKIPAMMAIIRKVRLQFNIKIIVVVWMRSQKLLLLDGWGLLRARKGD